MSVGEKCSFTFSLNKDSGLEFDASGERNASIYSALRSSDTFMDMMAKHHHKHIIPYENRKINSYVNLGMPLKCLPRGCHLQITVSKEKNNQEDEQILRQYENPDIECVRFYVAARGKTVKKIVKLKDLHRDGRVLCVYALKGETVSEALCKDGRFRSDLETLPWKLRDSLRKVYEKQSTVERVSHKQLEIDIPQKPSGRKGTHAKIKQESGNAIHEVGPREAMQTETEVHEPENDRDAENKEHGHENVPAPRNRGRDIEGKKRRTIFKIKRYYTSFDRKYRRKQHSRVKPGSHLGMRYAVNRDIQKEATDLWLQHFQILDKAFMQQFPNFSEEALGMRKYFQEERRRKKLPTYKQFNLYKKDFGKVTKNSTSVATYEHLIHLSKSVGFMNWDNNGSSGNATCFVFSGRFIFTCLHVVRLMVGENTDPRSWPAIISQCAKVTFTYKEFFPRADDWFSIEPWIGVANETLDYAILKLRDNGNGFPPGLFRHISPLPSSGLIYIIGHPQSQVKKIDGCAVIPLTERLKEYPEHLQHEVIASHAATCRVFPMFTQRSFLSEAWRTDTLSYDTCFSSGSSGSPVLTASGKLVAMHSTGHFYKNGDKVFAVIEFGYSMDSILCDVIQRNEGLYRLLIEEKNENLHGGFDNSKQELSFQHPQVEVMEH